MAKIFRNVNMLYASSAKTINRASGILRQSTHNLIPIISASTLPQCGSHAIQALMAKQNPMRESQTMEITMRLKLIYIVLFILIPLQAVDVLKAQSALSSENSGVMLTTYREQYQDAFSILIPQGWKAEGG